MKEEAAPAAGGGGGGGGGGASSAPEPAEPASKRRLSEISTLSSLDGEEDEEGGGAALPLGGLAHLMASAELAGEPVPAPPMPVKELRALAAEVKARASKLSAMPAADEDDEYVILKKEVYAEGKALEAACLRF